MTTAGIPYLPSTYESEHFENVVVHHAPAEDATHVQTIATLAEQGMRFVHQETSFIPSREIHLCVYHSNGDAQQALNRCIPPTMAMAPFAGQDAGLIAVHSPSAHPSNADPERMLRILTHECSHLVVAEATTSLKVLGDGNRSMRISTWINEGFAELLGCRAVGATDRLEAMHARFSNAQEYRLFGVLSECLDGLNHPARNDAFDHVTAAADLLAGALGVCEFFRDLQAIDRSIQPDEVCSPRRIQRQIELSLRARSGS